MTVILRDEFAEHWSAESAFAEVNKIEGHVVRNKEGRRTLRFEWRGRAYYLKHHKGVGWGEIVKCWTTLKAPVTSARNEWEAINRLHDLKVPTLTAVAYGIRGHNPAQQESFLITRELADTISLEDYVKPWPEQAPPLAKRYQLIQALADTIRVMHENGINHRDLYLCHFLMSCDEDSARPRLHVVDLHRAQCRSRVPRRWLVKDLGSIYFSALDIGLTRKDVLRFLKIYFGVPLRQSLKEHGSLLAAARARALQLYQRDFGRAPSVLY